MEMCANRLRRWRMRIFPALILLLLCIGACVAETAADGTVTGYFKTVTYVRSAMAQTKEYVDKIPAYSVVTMEAVDDTWAVYTSPAGVAGYVNYAKLLPEPDYERIEEYAVYSKKKVKVRGMAVYDAPTVYTAAENEVMTVDGKLSRFLHVRMADGTEGYVMPSWVKKAEFKPKSIKKVTFCAAEGTPLLEMPLQGSKSIGTLDAEEYYESDSGYGTYYVVHASGVTGYVEKSKVALWTAKSLESSKFFSFPWVSGVRRTEKTEEVYAFGLAGKEGATLNQPGGEPIQLHEGEKVYLFTSFGGWIGALAGDQVGYVRKRETEILTSGAVMERLRALTAGGDLRRSEYLDEALTMVEAGNPFQARYNLLTGAEVESILPLGVPYFWGGRKYEIMMERAPLYSVREAWQSSRTYYEKGTKYPYGFDCIGFVQSVAERSGHPVQGSITGHRAKEYCEAGAHLYCDDVHPLQEDWTEVARTLRAGDIMVIHHPGTHAMMYLGTLREFGYTEDQLPSLADWLDYPLMIHSGENPYYYFRFRNMIAGSEDKRISEATPPYGGVSVCILGVPREAAEMVIEAHDSTSYGFDVEGACVTIMSFGNVRDYFVFRPDGENPAVEPTAESADEMEAAGD